jgi:hypothetical protein
MTHSVRPHAQVTSEIPLPVLGQFPVAALYARRSFPNGGHRPPLQLLTHYPSPYFASKPMLTLPLCSRRSTVPTEPTSNVSIQKLREPNAVAPTVIKRRASSRSIGYEIDDQRRGRAGGDGQDFTFRRIWRRAIRGTGAKFFDEAFAQFSAFAP